MTFKPTIFYIKQHTVTGLKYFGKTTRVNVREGYKGGGSYWVKHIKKHGPEHVRTIWTSEIFTDRETCIDFGLTFSELFDIVKSSEWANLEFENGIDGGTPGSISPHRGKVLTDEHKKNLSISLSGRVAPNKGKPSPLKGRTSPIKGKTTKLKGQPSPKKGLPNEGASLANKGIPKKKVTCPHCGKEGGVNTMYRYHFENCKLKENDMQ